jgi:hypothetical protein
MGEGEKSTISLWEKIIKGVSSYISQSNYKKNCRCANKIDFAYRI